MSDEPTLPGVPLPRPSDGQGSGPKPPAADSPTVNEFVTADAEEGQTVRLPKVKHTPQPPRPKEPEFSGAYLAVAVGALVLFLGMLVAAILWLVFWSPLFEDTDPFKASSTKPSATAATGPSGGAGGPGGMSGGRGLGGGRGPGSGRRGGSTPGRATSSAPSISPSSSPEKSISQ